MKETMFVKTFANLIILIFARFEQFIVRKPSLNLLKINFVR